MLGQTCLTLYAVVVMVVRTGFSCQSRYDWMHQYRPRAVIESTTRIQKIFPKTVWYEKKI